MIRISLEFSGGLELLFSNQKRISVSIPVQKCTMANLIAWVKDNLLQERPELFIKGNSLRPGILVLINGCDWELSGDLASEVADGDNVVFISTLHGG